MLRQKNLERPIFLLTRAEDWLIYAAERVKTYIEKRRKRG
jgi:hypothetical protein